MEKRKKEGCSGIGKSEIYTHKMMDHNNERETERERQRERERE